jgi:alkylation response protein AidB-like acyl-CoA dehydrogenase
MYIGYDETQEELRAELRAYYTDLLTDDVRERLAEEEGCGPVHREIVGKMGSDGWLTVGWPEEYGGRGYSAVEQFVMFDESVAIGAPIPMLTINTVGPTLMQYGTEEQKQFFLPKISRGEITFCIGYSEPDAGTDLAALQCRAVKDGDEYIINGQKTWTSLAKDADYIWLAARTNTEVKKHKGISLFCIPMDTPGLSIEPLDLLSSHDINHTFFDDVRIPASTMIGEENGGWGLITSQLNRERVTICSSGMVSKALEETIDYAKNTKRADGSRVIDQAWVQRNLAEVTAGLEYLRLANWKVAWTVATKIDSAGSSNNESDMDNMTGFIADSSGVKVYGTEFYTRAYRRLMEIYGPQAAISKGQIGHVTRLEMQYRSTVILTFGGGTNEMQRDLVSQFGLGYPKADR